jgi:hypothetical protein
VAIADSLSARRRRIVDELRGCGYSVTDRGT